MNKSREAKRRMCLRLHNLGFTTGDIADEVGMTRGGVFLFLKSKEAYDPHIIDNVKSTYHKRRSIAYWADYYALPVKSCYEQFSKCTLGTYKNDGVGSPRLVTESEFLSRAIYTRAGKKLMSKLLLKGLLLTRSQIKGNINK